jgi:hypothetical protein
VKKHGGEDLNETYDNTDSRRYPGDLRKRSPCKNEHSDREEECGKANGIESCFRPFLPYILAIHYSELLVGELYERYGPVKGFLIDVGKISEYRANANKTYCGRVDKKGKILLTIGYRR